MFCVFFLLCRRGRAQRSLSGEEAYLSQAVSRTALFDYKDWKNVNWRDKDLD